MANFWPPVRDKNLVIIDIRDKDRKLDAIERYRKGALLTATGFGASAVIASIGALVLNHWFLFFLAIVAIVALTLFSFFAFPITQRYSNEYIRYSREKEVLEAELHEMKYGDQND